MNEELTREYLDLLRSVESLHRSFMEVIKIEIERKGFPSLNNVQAMLLFNIGDNDVAVGKLTNLGYYSGSNVSYNTSKLTEAGYLIYEPSLRDRRSARVKLSPQGEEVRKCVAELLDRHAENLARAGIKSEQINYAVLVSKRLAQYLNNLLRMRF
ncbi:MAG: MarR family transcriptional regulator [Pseudomonadota bacterium]